MREILFRGKALASGDWVYGDYITIYDSPRYKAISTRGIETKRRIYEVDPATVGQYTGLTDENGKKIFEGDVIQTTKYGVDNGRGQNYSGKDKFIVGYSEGTYTLENGRRRFCLRPDTDAIVCGNIYDNPELLEEAQHDD